MTLYLWAKTLHIIAVVAWFAGLFYLPRLFVYHAEALAGPEPARAVLHAQFGRMERILERAIMRPALAMVIAAATTMVALNPALLTAGWLQSKLALVGGVVVYHAVCLRYMERLARGEAPLSSQAFRLFNEVPTVLLVLVVFLVVFRRQATAGQAAGLAAGFGTLLLLGVFGAARRRARAAQAARGVAGPVPVAAVPVR